MKEGDMVVLHNDSVNNINYQLGLNIYSYWTTLGGQYGNHNETKANWNCYIGYTNHCVIPVYTLFLLIYIFI